MKLTRITSDHFEQPIIYDGMFDINDDGKDINISIGDKKIMIDLRQAIKIGNPVIDNLSVVELKKVLLDNKLRMTIFPNGNCHFNKQNSEHILNSCYLSQNSDGNLVFIIAFDEIQPTRYQAQLISIYQLNR